MGGACYWQGLVVDWLLLWWEGLLSEEVRGLEEEAGGAICCLSAMEAGGWGQQQPILHHLADQLIVVHIHADQ